MKRLNNFTEDESGAVTVDWVVLTAAIVGIAIAVIGLISGGVETASESINDEIVVASNFSFGGSTYEFIDKTYGDYSDEAFANAEANGGAIDIFQDIANDAPSGYGFAGDTNNDGYPVYRSIDGTTTMTEGVVSSTAGTQYADPPEGELVLPAA